MALNVDFLVFTHPAKPGRTQDSEATVNLTVNHTLKINMNRFVGMMVTTIQTRMHTVID